MCLFRQHHYSLHHAEALATVCQGALEIAAAWLILIKTWKGTVKEMDGTKNPTKGFQPNLSLSLISLAIILLPPQPRLWFGCKVALHIYVLENSRRGQLRRATEREGKFGKVRVVRARFEFTILCLVYVCTRSRFNVVLFGRYPGYSLCCLFAHGDGIL